MEFKNFLSNLSEDEKKKKIIIIVAIVLAVCLILSTVLTVAFRPKTKSKEEFTKSKEAFALITDAYMATNDFSGDIYEAWHLGVNDKYSYDDDYELSDFADEMSIELEHIKQATANLLGKSEYSYGDWEDLPSIYEYSYFSAWVSAISEAYKCSGKVAEIEKDLNKAMNLMKELGDEYSDYTHYPSLKNYFTNSIAFLDFCREPEGSFEQVVETFNAYRNTAREHFFDLNYVFNNSIDGMADTKK